MAQESCIQSNLGLAKVVKVINIVLASCDRSLLDNNQSGQTYCMFGFWTPVTKVNVATKLSARTVRMAKPTQTSNTNVITNTRT